MNRVLFLIALAAAAVSAQTSRGSVAGLVQDPSGAAVAAGGVELRNLETGVVRTTPTNEGGLYRFDAVDPGRYDLTVKLTGFKSFTARNFSVLAGQALNVDARMEIGDVQATVEVSAEGVALQTESMVRGSNIERTNIVQLPFSARNPVQLAFTLPGVNTSRFVSGSDSFSVNGSRGRSNNFLIDGTENNDISVGGQAFQIRIPDAVQEVAVQTSNYDAEFGRAAGAVVNVVTRAGTNSLHGTASYLLDSTTDDAITNTQSLSPDIQKRGKPFAGTNQIWNGTLGSRIVKDRTFFFVAFGEDRRNAQASNSLRVLSANGRATLQRLFPKGTNPRADLYDQVTTGLNAGANFFNVPLGAGRPDLEFGQAVASFGRNVGERQYMIRMDHKLGERDQLSGRFMNSFRGDPRGGATNPFAGFETGTTEAYRNALITHTHVFSANMTNEARMHYNRIGLDFPGATANPLGLTLPRYEFGSAAISGIGVQTNLPQGRLANNYGFQDTVTIVRGAHAFRFGADVLQQRAKQFAPIILRGQLDYRDGGGFSYFANYLDDFGGSGPGGGSAQRDFGTNAYYPDLTRFAFFFQDRWRMRKNLTLTLGLRYENFGQPINTLRTPAFTGLFNINPTTFTGPFDQPNQVKNDNNNFGPTLGLAWTVRPKTVFRLGYQVSFDTFFNNIASNASTSSPNVIATQVQSVVDGTSPRVLPRLSASLPLVARTLTPLDTQNLVIGNLVNPYVQRFSGGIQHELPAGMILDVSYVGSKGTRLFWQEEYNPVVPSGLVILPNGDIPAARRASRFDGLQGRRAIRTNGGSSTYHALQTQLNRRFSKGLLTTVAYTWSKNLDNGSELFTFNSNPAPSMIPTIFGGERLDRAFSLFDRTHRLTFSYFYELPWRKQNRVLGGWGLSGVTSFETGVPLTVLNGIDADGYEGSTGDRPDYNPNGQRGVRAVIDRTSPTGYRNPDAVGGSAPIDPAQAQFIQRPAFAGTVPLRPSTLGRNTQRTPGQKNWNLNVLKTVKVTEQLRMEFRTEFYNLFNTPQYGTPGVSPFAPQTQGLIGNNVGTTPAGQFLAPQFVDGGGRMIRYQLKLIF